MGIIEFLVTKELKRKGYSAEEARAKGITKEDVLKELDAETVQLMAALPTETMDYLWTVLGVVDG